MKAHLLTAVLIIGTIGLGLKSTSTMAQTIIYVKADGTGDGTSWANACNLDDIFGRKGAHPITSPNTEVWVQKGTHTPSQMLTIPANVKMYGSFNGSESSLGARSVVDHSTVIDAQQKYGSVVHLGESALLDGFTIKNGSAQWNPRRNGGGVYAEDSSTIANCFIIDNVAGLNGGGVYAREVTFISNTTIENNTATDLGNEIYGCCIAIDGGQCLAPFICSHPSPKAETRINLDRIGFPALSVRAVGTEPFTYEWFSNTTNSTVGGTLVGTDSVYTPSHEKAGSKYYYFAVVTNSCGADTSALSGLHTVMALEFDYTGTSKEIVLTSGDYIIECWGAQGYGNGVANAGKGGYVKGVITLKETTKFYIFVGATGMGTGANTTTFNGGTGSSGGWPGGGASDVRLVNGAWNNVASLRSRIIIAGGGGSATSGVGGAGGGLIGLTGRNTNNSNQIVTPAQGGSQTKGGANMNTYPVSGFGYGGGGAGGGGGYYGGGGADNNGGGGGGSSFISGHTGCNAINADGSHRGNSIHYSGVIFTETETIAGNASMPNPRGTGNITGNSGHGFVRISHVK